jgi:hypothetical protein
VHRSAFYSRVVGLGIVVGMRLSLPCVCAYDPIVLLAWFVACMSTLRLLSSTLGVQLVNMCQALAKHLCLVVVAFHLKGISHTELLIPVVS